MANENPIENAPVEEPVAPEVPAEEAVASAEEVQAAEPAVAPAVAPEAEAEPEAEAAAPAEEREQLRRQLKAMASSNNAPRVAPPRPGVFRSKRGPQAGTTIDRNGAYEDPEAAARREAEIEIYQSYLRKRVLSGKVIGVHRRHDSSGKNRMLYYAQVKTDKYEVLIPCDKFTDTDFEAMCMRWRELDPNRTVEDTIEKYLRDRLNAEVDFTISHIVNDDDSGLSDNGLMVAGDRLDAMYRQRVYHWFGTNRTTGEYQLQVGSKVEARVIMTARRGIRIEVFGVESFVRSRDLDYTFIQDARTEFEVGQRVWVILNKIERNEENDYSVEYEASVRDAKPDPRERAMNIYLEGSVFVGEINYPQVPTPERPNVRPAVFVKLPHEGVQVSCPFPSGPVAPVVGAKCYVTITNRDLRNNRLYGIIQHIIPPK